MNSGIEATMTTLLLTLILLAAPLPPSLNAVRAEPNPDHRAKAAIDYAGVAEKNAETAYAQGDMPRFAAQLKEIEDSLDAAQQAFNISGKTPGRNPGPYKYAEMHSRDLLIRLGDLEQRMDVSERGALRDLISKVQTMHDAWFEGIMGRKR